VADSKALAKEPATPHNPPIPEALCIIMQCMIMQERFIIMRLPRFKKYDKMESGK
jgi:hypothetical protein